MAVSGPDIRLGNRGKSHFAADRKVGKQTLAAIPGGRSGPREKASASMIASVNAAHSSAARPEATEGVRDGAANRATSSWKIAANQS